MKKQNNLSFEDQWVSAFEEAELAPAPGVWNSIELSITKASNASNKKRILFFQLLAAASIAFATILGSYVLYNSNVNVNNNDKQVLSSNEESLSSGYNIGKEELQIEKESKEVKSSQKSAVPNQSRSADNYRESDVKNQSMLDESDEEDIFEDYEELGRPGETIQDYATLEGNSRSEQVSDQSITALTLNDDIQASTESSSEASNNLTFLERLGINLGFVEPVPGDLRLVPWYASAQERSRKKNTVWTGLGLSAGSFNPNTGANSDESTSVANNIPESFFDAANNSAEPVIGEERPGSSFGIGVNFGKQVSSKIVVISGLSYLQQSSTSFSNIVGDGRVVSAFDEVSSLAQVDVTDRYEIENTYRSISIPLQAGYYLVNRKFGVLLLAGVSNDFFLRRSITDQTGAIQSEQFGSDASGYS